eukprot:PhM_4_TR7351/c0_g1_i1/m.74169
MSSDIDRRLALEIQEVFDMFDEDSNGYIDAIELQHALSTITGNQVSPHDVLELLRQYDRDESGSLTLDEFTYMVSDKMKSRKSADDLLKTFQFLCGNSTEISAASLRQAASDVGEILSEAEARELISAALGGVDGFVDFAAFCAVQRAMHEDDSDPIAQPPPKETTAARKSSNYRTDSHVFDSSAANPPDGTARDQSETPPPAPLEAEPTVFAEGFTFGDDGHQEPVEGQIVQIVNNPEENKS